MSTTYATKFMNLSLPIPGITKGPTWATLINTAFQTVDQHDHTPGKGKYISSTAITIAGDLEFDNYYGFTYGVNSAKFLQLKDISTYWGGQTPGIDGALFNFKGDLWWQYSVSGNIPTGLLADIGTFTQLTSYSNSYSQTSSLEPIYISSATYEVGALEKVSYVLITSQPTTLTLPKISTLSSGGRYFLIQDHAGTANTNNITITPNAADSIGTGGAGVSHTINTNYGYIWIISDGTSKWIQLTSA